MGSGNFLKPLSSQTPKELFFMVFAVKTDEQG